MKDMITDPTVRLVDYTGMVSSDPLYAAKKLLFTKKTRLDQDANAQAKIFAMDDDEVQKELDYVRDSVRSSWEFVTFTFQISDVSRSFTHQLVRTRTASYAQQSQRVVDMSGFDYIVPKVIQENPDALNILNQCMIDINDAYEGMIGLGIPAQDARAVLPTCVSTSIIVELNLRTLADLAGKRDNPRAEGEYFKVFKQMADVAIEAMPWIEDFLYPPRMETPELDRLLVEKRGDASPVDQPHVNQAMKELDRLKGVWG